MASSADLHAAVMTYLTAYGGAHGADAAYPEFEFSDPELEFAAPADPSSIRDVFFILLLDMQWGSQTIVPVNNGAAVVKSSDAKLLMCPAVEQLCDAHLAKKCLKLARGHRVRIEGAPQTYFFDAPSLLFESSVGKLGELGRGFVCFNCKDTATMHPHMQHCDSCKFARYCSKACQKSHWKIHKATCTHITSVFKYEQLRRTKQVYYGHVSFDTMTCWVDLIKETMRSVPYDAQPHHLVKQGSLYGRQLTSEEVEQMQLMFRCERAYS